MVEVSGSTPLTQRLRDAAWDEMRDAPYSNWSYGDLPERERVKVDRTIAAVLTGLARSGQVAWAESLKALADSIERGE